MADEGLPVGGEGEGQAKPEGGTPKAAAQAAAQPAGVTLDDVRRVVNESLGPVATALDHVADSYEEALKGRSAGKGEGEPKKEDAGSEDWFADPEKATRDLVAKASAEGNQQTLNLLSALAYNGTVPRLREEFEKTYGEGQWEESKFGAAFNTLYERLTPEQRANPTAIETIASTLKGHPQFHETLYKLRVERESKIEEQIEQAEKEAEMSPGMLTGGRRRATAPDKLTDDERDFLARWNKNVDDGDRFTEKQYLEARKLYHSEKLSESDWADFFKEDKAA